MITIKDVAKRAGVSVTTVSFVINGKYKITDAVKDKVWEAIKELNYVPNMNAKNLVSGKSGCIGLFVPDYDYLKSSIFFTNLMSGILSYTIANEYNLVVSLFENDSVKWKERLSTVDGAIVINPQQTDEYEEHVQCSDVPIVIIGRPTAKIEHNVTYVDVDNVSIAYNITKHLLKLNHKKIAVLCGPADYTITIDQLTGYKMALQESGIEYDERLIGHTDYLMKNDLDEIKTLYNSSDKITAIIAASDTQAIRVMCALKDLGISVPKDISVACLSGTFMTYNYEPKITSGDVNTEEIGRVAANKLLELVKRHVVRPTYSIVPYQLFVGESTAHENR